MSEYQGIAEQILIILEELKKEGGIHVDQIPSVVNGVAGLGTGVINCYPGTKGSHCCQLSLFLSLTSPPYTKGRGHINCRGAMEKIVQHMQGSCFQKTNVAIFVTDNWNAVAFDGWQANLEHIRSFSHIEVYLISGRAVSEIYI